MMMVEVIVVVVVKVKCLNGEISLNEIVKIR